MNSNESKTDFAIILFTGMIVFNLFAESVNRTPGLIIYNVNYVKKVVFPLEILAWVALGSVLFHSLVSLFVLLLAQFILNQSLPWTIMLFPLVLLPLILSSLGAAWFLAAIGVYVRDVGQITGVITTILMFFVGRILSIVSAARKISKPAKAQPACAHHHRKPQCIDLWQSARLAFVRDCVVCGLPHCVFWLLVVPKDTQRICRCPLTI